MAAALPPAQALAAPTYAGHRCTAENTVMQCAQPPGPATAEASRSAPAAGGYGVDFAWSCPVGVARNFGVGYLSYDPSKDWSRACVDQFHARHKATAAVFEAGGCDPTKGWSLGYSQAKLAARELRVLGAPSNQPFTMAVDCNVAGWRLVPYFRGANAAEPGRVNAFGGYYQVAYLYRRHLVGHYNWQTYAWSGGRWLPPQIAPLQQYYNTGPWDYDRAIAVNYGQWPAASAARHRRQ